MSSQIINTNLSDIKTKVHAATTGLDKDKILTRIWKLDHTVWKPNPDEIVNRLGWLHAAQQMQLKMNSIFALVDEVKSDGYTQALLLGMGGSSLAPEVFRKVFGVKKGYLDLSVLDTTDPGAILSAKRGLDLTKTLFIVATKSGSTVETISFFKYFYNLVAGELGNSEAGQHFIAITDPGSKLEKLGQEFKFRKIFRNDPNIGGRYSALSFFGLVPASMIGVDIQRLFERVFSMIKDDETVETLGAILGAAAEEGRDKVTFLISNLFESFGDWVEQLIAESTGKEGKGILPVVHESLGETKVYENDRLFIHIYFNEREAQKADVIKEAGHPVVDILLKDKYDLGGQYFLWEMAVALACYELKINPFNQPNVENAKVQAREMVAEFHQSGSLPEGDSAPLNPESLQTFLATAKPGDYIALQAYLQPNHENQAALQKLRVHLRNRYGLATTLGFGPRFLHSTGQLHKGDAGNGFFIQFITDPLEDVSIPNEAGKPGSTMTFGTLIKAQALGDEQALLEENRRFIRFKLDNNAISKNILNLFDQVD